MLHSLKERKRTERSERKRMRCPTLVPAAHGQQVQPPLQGVREGDQGLEAAGGGESGGGQ